MMIMMSRSRSRAHLLGKDEIMTPRKTKAEATATTDESTPHPTEAEVASSIWTEIVMIIDRRHMVAVAAVVEVEAEASEGIDHHTLEVLQVEN